MKYSTLFLVNNINEGVTNFIEVDHHINEEWQES